MLMKCTYDFMSFGKLFVFFHVFVALEDIKIHYFRLFVDPVYKSILHEKCTKLARLKEQIHNNYEQNKQPKYDYGKTPLIRHLSDCGYDRNAKKIGLSEYYRKIRSCSKINNL